MNETKLTEFQNQVSDDIARLEQVVDYLDSKFGERTSELSGQLVQIENQLVDMSRDLAVVAKSLADVAGR